MSATVGSLLDRFHTLAYQLEPDSAPERAETAHLAASWARLSSRLTHALTALPYEFDGAGAAQRDHVKAVLQPFRSRANRPGNDTRSDPRLEDAILCVGAISDLLVTHRTPYRVPLSHKWRDLEPKHPNRVYQGRDKNEPASIGLQHNLAAATYAIAEWSLHRLNINGTANTRFGRSLERVTALTHPSANTNPDQRRSGLELVTAIPLDEPSLLGALARWAEQAEQGLHRRVVTSGTFAMLANDLALLTAATLHTLKTNDPTAIARLNDAGITENLTQAHQHWRQVAAWPTDIRMGGARARDFIAASRELRSYIDADLRGPKRWLTSGELSEHFTRDHLDHTAYTLAQQAVWTGDALNKTIRDMTIGQGRMWVDTDTMRARDPNFHRVRVVPQPDAETPVVVPINWHILSTPTRAAIELGNASRTAAQHTQEAAWRIEDHYTANPTPPERIPALSLARDRIRLAQMNPTQNPQAGRPPTI